MNNSILTNTLLLVISVLLLVLVIQNSIYGPTHQRPSFVVSESSAPPASAPAHPSGGGGAPMATDMIFHAVKAFPAGCNGKKVLAECDSAAAEAIKAKIIETAEAGSGVRQIFDMIVSNWGENVLTDEALQIRKMRRAK